MPRKGNRSTSQESHFLLPENKVPFSPSWRKIQCPFFFFAFSFFSFSSVFFSSLPGISKCLLLLGFPDHITGKAFRIVSVRIFTSVFTLLYSLLCCLHSLPLLQLLLLILLGFGESIVSLLLCQVLTYYLLSLEYGRNNHLGSPLCNSRRLKSGPP